MTPESKIKKEIVAYLDSLGDRCWHVAYTNVHGYGRKGVPDRLLSYKGKFVALEIKSDVGKPTLWQEKQIDAIRTSGGLAFVVRSVHAVKHIIKHLDTDIALNSLENREALERCGPQ